MGRSSCRVHPCKQEYKVMPRPVPQEVPHPALPVCPRSAVPLYHQDDSGIGNLQEPPVTGVTHTHTLPFGSSVGAPCPAPSNHHSIPPRKYAVLRIHLGTMTCTCPPPSVPIPEGAVVRVVRLYTFCRAGGGIWSTLLSQSPANSGVLANAQCSALCIARILSPRP